MKKDKLWKMSKNPLIYVGHEVSSNQIYINGSKYVTNSNLGEVYTSADQLYFTMDEVKWLLKNLPKAIKRNNRKRK